MPIYLLLFLKTDGMGRSIIVLLILCCTIIILMCFISLLYPANILCLTGVSEKESPQNTQKAVLKYGNLSFQLHHLEGHRPSLPP